MSTQVDIAGLHRPDGRLDVATALQPYNGPWNERLAAHLLRRAGFGGTPDEIRRLAAMSPGDAVSSLIHFPSTANLPAPDNVFDTYSYVRDNFGRGFGALSPDQKEMRNREMRKIERDSIVSLQQWWLNRMLTTPAPLQEKMAFYFHGHFTTAAIQKGVSPAMVYNQNQLFRSYALGNVRELTRNVSKDPAMLIYLDNTQNNKSHPNENYARELMELFTLGIGNYTEDDVRQSARAWTGWVVNRRMDGQAEFNARIHDDGNKTFLGQSGNFTGDDVVNVIFAKPQCARFFATSLLNFFVYNNPEPELVDRVAGLLEKHSYELAPVMSQIFHSNVFFSDRAYRALVKSPVEYVVGTYKTLGLPAIDAFAMRSLNGMGQILFYPPNVAGWPPGENWLTSQMLIARQNFAAQLVNSQAMMQSSWMSGVPTDPRNATKDLVGTILQGDASPYADGQLIEYLDGNGTSALAMLSMENREERIRGAAYLAMAMPAYQLS